MMRSSKDMTAQGAGPRGTARSRSGTSYVEYFIVATAVAVGTMAIFTRLYNEADPGDPGTVFGAGYWDGFQDQMNDIAGPLSGPPVSH